MKLICYLSNGFPTIEESVKIAEYYVAGGCDAIEIDLPSKNPYLESDFISNRVATALAACDDYDRYMENIIQIKHRLPDTEIILLSYENTVKEIGVQKFIDFCLANDLTDIIFVGLENENIKDLLIDNGIKVSCYVQFNMIPEEIDSAKASNGFVYMQAKTIPEKINPRFPTLADCIKYLRAQGIERKIYCGVGIYEPSDFKMVKDAKGDGAFVGSTILKLCKNPEKLMATIASFKAVDKLK